MFVDRADAGRRLGARLAGLAPGDPVVLGLARGGVVVAREVADALHAPLDVLVVRKLGHPAQPELALGALGEGGVVVVDEDLVRRLRVSPQTIESLVERESGVLEARVRRLRGERPLIEVRDRLVVVVDDGLATGSTARAALRVLRARGAARLVLAVPVGAPDTVARLRDDADEVVCLSEPPYFFAIGEHYEDFRPVEDDEVAALLAPPRGV